MNTRIGWFLVIILLIVIVILSWLLFMTPTPSSTGTVATSTTASTETSTQTTATTTTVRTVPTVTSPTTGQIVSKTFTATGEAPGNWYSEAVFPIQVRDADNNVIGHGQAQAQGDWMTTAMVPFSASVTIDTSYIGAASLVLLKDNPSGLPQNDDSITVPITIQ